MGSNGGPFAPFMYRKQVLCNTIGCIIGQIILIKKISANKMKITLQGPKTAKQSTQS